MPRPVADRSADMIVCDYVMEHLPDPNAFIREASRVLVAGGFVCIRTPNAHSYMGIAAKLIPNRHHKRVVSKVQLARREHEPSSPPAISVQYDFGPARSP